MMILTNTVILASEFHETHGHIYCLSTTQLAKLHLYLLYKVIMDHKENTNMVPLSLCAYLLLQKRVSHATAKLFQLSAVMS
jgi:hypothetical protein